MTYSIVARCSRTGQLGVAVASHAFGVGAVVPWGRPGVGAGATQSLPDRRYNAELPRLLASGAEPAEALERVLESDERAGVRQVGVVSHLGQAATHTGDLCVPFAGGFAAEDLAVQGNLLAADGIWTAMAGGFAATSGELADRLLAVLRIAEDLGGDIRGRQAAALLVVAADPEGGVLVDLRVDDHPDPVGELDRLLTLRRADLLMRDAIARALADRPDADEVIADLRAAQTAFGPGNLEPSFWQCVVRARTGAPDPTLVPRHPGWAALYRRLIDTGLVPEREAP